MIQTRGLALLLALSAVNLVLMVPGGMVETRSFAGYSIGVLAAFNVFLTLLGFGSLILAYRVFRSRRVGIFPVFAGAAFAAVYLLDLAAIFPIAEAPMSIALASMEWIGTVLGVVIMAVGGCLALPSMTNAPGLRRCRLDL